MGKITTDKLPDMQLSNVGFYKKRIAKVGVRGIEQILPIKMKDGSTQTPVALISSYCSLDPTFKGINMSRITRTINRVLNEESSKDGFKDLEKFCKELAEAHHSPDIYIKAKFKLILSYKTPMSDIYSQEPVECVIESQFRDNIYKTFLTVKSTEMSLCPCSREMSLLKNNLTKEEEDYLYSGKVPSSLFEKIQLAGFGAHNQKSKIEVKTEIVKDNFIWIEDMVEIIKMASACPSFSVLKRNDEKWVTEVSYMGKYIDDDKHLCDTEYNSAVFVEDINRELARRLDPMLDKNIKDYCCVVCNEESIHSGEIEAVSVLSAGRELA